MTTMTQPVPPVSPSVVPPQPPSLPSAPPTSTTPVGRVPIPALFENGQQWIDALGNVPLSRIVFDPWPGTATDADLLRLTEVENRWCELVDGTLVEKPVGFLESQVAMRLGMYLGNFVYPRDLGVITGGDGTLRMAAGQVRLPDVTFIHVSDLPGGRVPAEAIPTLPPTLAVEVLSPSNTTREMRRKTAEYFASGSKLVWRVDPRAWTVAVFDGPTDEPARLLTAVDTLDGGAALPGFTLPIADLFRHLAPPPNQD